jgi:hypothetical protein
MGQSPAAIRQEHSSVHTDFGCAKRTSARTEWGWRHARHLRFPDQHDNLFPKSKLKITSEETEVMKARWKYGLVLVGLALLHDEAHETKTGESEDHDNAEET